MKTMTVQVGNCLIGGNNPIVIQSMTNTPTDKVQLTVDQIMELANAGSKLVRMTVNTPAAAKAVPEIKKQLVDNGYAELPLIGDFHFNGHILLERYPECAQVLDKYRINPTNAGQSECFEQIIKIAIKNHKPVRIGLNWGALPEGEVSLEALVKTAIESAAQAEKIGLASNKIVLSVKVSEVMETVRVNELLHKRCQELNKMYPLHIGVTEAGSGTQGVITSSAALAILLNQGIGNTIRMSLTPTPDSKRTDEVVACKQILQALDLRSFRPRVTSCPGCGRTSNDFYQKLAAEINEFVDESLPEWQSKYPEVVNLKIAVMGCMVNGPGEARLADIGIMLPGQAGIPVAHVYQNGKLFKTLENTESIVQEFKIILSSFVAEKYC